MDLQHTHSRYVSVTCASFLPGDVNNFVVGTEDGNVYTASRHGKYVIHVFFTVYILYLHRVLSLIHI